MHGVYKRSLLFLQYIMNLIFVYLMAFYFALNQQDLVFISLLTAVIRLGSEVPGAKTVESFAKSIALKDA